MRKEIPVIAVAWLALTAPAGAACLDEVVRLEQRLNRLETAAAQQRSGGGDEAVRLRMEGGREVEVTVEEAVEDEAAQPQESWFGESPPTPKGAEDELRNARGMAEAGDEPGCLGHVEQAARIITALEEQQR